MSNPTTRLFYDNVLMASLRSTKPSNSKYGILEVNQVYGTRYLCPILPSHPIEHEKTISPYWRCYFPNTSAIIYVIDSSDHDRLQTSRTELLTMLSEEELVGVPLLVFCNKQDVPGALKPEDVSEKLGLAGGETKREWSVRGSCATKGEGLEEGLDWYVLLDCSPLFLRLIYRYRLVNAIQKK